MSAPEAITPIPRGADKDRFSAAGIEQEALCPCRCFLSGEGVAVSKTSPLSRVLIRVPFTIRSIFLREQLLLCFPEASARVALTGLGTSEDEVRSDGCGVGKEPPHLFMSSLVFSLWEARSVYQASPLPRVLMINNCKVSMFLRESF